MRGTYGFGRNVALSFKKYTHFYTKFCRNLKWDQFLKPGATNCEQNLSTISHYFSKLLSFQANFGNFCLKLMKLGLFTTDFESMTRVLPVFALTKRSLLYQESDFVTHLSAARHRKDFCTKNTPHSDPTPCIPGMHILSNML